MQLFAFFNFKVFRKSLVRFDVFTVAMGCVLLSCKVEEKPKSVREVWKKFLNLLSHGKTIAPQILFIFHHMYQRRKKLKLTALELGGARYNSWKSELFLIEARLLKELGFSLYAIMDHPHKYILYFVKLVNGTQQLSQEAWNYLNDCLRLDVSLRYEAREVACAATLLAAKKIGFDLAEGCALVLVVVLGVPVLCAFITRFFSFHQLFTLSSPEFRSWFLVY